MSFWEFLKSSLAYSEDDFLRPEVHPGVYTTVEGGVLAGCWSTVILCVRLGFVRDFLQLNRMGYSILLIR